MWKLLVQKMLSNAESKQMDRGLVFPCPYLPISSVNNGFLYYLKQLQIQKTAEKINFRNSTIQYVSKLHP